MRILIVSNMYPSKEKSFAGIFVKNQYLTLKSLLPKDSFIDVFYMERKFTTKIGSVFKYVKTFFKFFPFLFRRYDIIHLHYFFPLIYLVNLYKIFHKETKVVVTYHGSDLTKKVNSKNQYQLKKLASKVDCHISVGKALGDILVEKLDVQSDLILPVGVNDKVFFYEKTKKVYDFVYVGSFVHRKGVDLIIEAVKRMNSSISICFIGQGDYLHEIEALVNKYSNVFLYEGLTQQEIQKILVKSKFLLLPTRNEGFPTSTIESMYCGVPVLVSDIPQTKEQVFEGENGFIIPVDNSLALLEKMEFLAKIDVIQYDEMVEKTRTYFREISLTGVCLKLIEIYEGLNSENN
ncbi:glycosyltransferase family 4 protein [Formosa sp. S-31]|uniref:glycosyltransferase family 4 protein n=1 Tax=Formosa sp. S-31 TaxID=2790949 RepID=UPI003EC1060E